MKSSHMEIIYVFSVFSRKDKLVPLGMFTSRTMSKALARASAKELAKEHRARTRERTYVEATIDFLG